MVSPSNPAMVLIVTYEYIFYLPSSERSRPLVRWKARRLLLGSYTPGTVGHQLRSKNLDTVSSLQRQTAEKSSTPYRIWPHHSWLKRKGHQHKMN
jgi:hypothetical protein